MARKGDGLYLRGRTWYLAAHINGVRHQVRLGKGISRKIALELAQVQRGAILRGELGIGKKPRDVCFDEARKKFETWVEVNKKPGTTKTYKECLGRVSKFFSGKQLSQISSFHVEAYKQARVNAGARVVVNRELSVLRSLFNRCKEWRLYEGSNPVVNVKMLKEPRQRLRFLEHEEEACLLAACAEPLRTLIVIGINCGIRLKSEALTLRWADVDLGRKTLIVQSAFAKNGYMRAVSLNSTALAALSQLPRISDFVFAKPNGTPDYATIRGFRVACRKVGLTDVTPHTLRHTFASRLLASGVDPIMATRLGGWSSIKMLDRYCHANPSRMAEAVEKIVQHSTTLFTTPEIRRIGNTA
jgi:integrase